MPLSVRAVVLSVTTALGGVLLTPLARSQPGASALAHPASASSSAPAASERNAVSAVVPGDPAPPSTGTCEAGGVTRVYEAVRRSVLKIDTDHGLGSGFFFGSGHLIATAFHVVERPAGLTVLTADGGRYPAEVVAIDRANDLALLRLPDSAPDGVPLEVARPAVRVGDTVLAIGHPFGTWEGREKRLQGLLSWSVSRGIVSERNARLVQSDVSINPGNSGGPLVDCGGRVVGVVSFHLSGSQGLGFAIAAEQLAALVPRASPGTVYRGPWFELGLMLGGVAQQGDDRRWLGLTAAPALHVADRWLVRLGLTSLWDVSTDESPLQARTSNRVALEPAVSYRLQLWGGRLPLAPSLGAAITRETTTRRTVALTVDPTCEGPVRGCTVRSSVDTQKHSRTVVFPTAGLDLLFSNTTLGYTFQLDTGTPGHSVHRLTIGSGF